MTAGAPGGWPDFRVRDPGRHREQVPQLRRTGCTLERQPPQDGDLRLACLRGGGGHGRQRRRQEPDSGCGQFSGEAGRAEQTLYGAGLRPNTEHLLIQSQTLKVGDPEFTATIEDATARLSRTHDVRNVVSPLTGGARSQTTGTPRWSTSRSPATRSRRLSGSTRRRRRWPRSRTPTRSCGSSSSGA